MLPVGIAGPEICDFPHRMVLQSFVLLCTNILLQNYFPVRLRRNEFPDSKCPACNLILRAIRAFGKGVQDERFKSKLLGVSIVDSAGEKGRAWEHGSGTFCKLLSSHFFFQCLERSEKVFRKRRFVSKFLGVFFFCFEGRKESTWEHKARTT